MAVVLEVGLGFPSPPEGQSRPGGKLAPEGERTLGWLRWAWGVWGVWKAKGSAVTRQRGQAYLMQCFCVCRLGHEEWRGCGGEMLPPSDSASPKAGCIDPLELCVRGCPCGPTGR